MILRDLLCGEGNGLWESSASSLEARVCVHHTIHFSSQRDGWFCLRCVVGCLQRAAYWELFGILPAIHCLMCSLVRCRRRRPYDDFRGGGSGGDRYGKRSRMDFDGGRPPRDGRIL